MKVRENNTQKLFVTVATPSLFSSDHHLSLNIIPLERLQYLLESICYERKIKHLKFLALYLLTGLSNKKRGLSTS